MQWKNKVVLITGGTGSFGQAFTRYLLKKSEPPTIRIFSRDEFKQYHMQEELVADRKYLRFFLGDVRDKNRLLRAMQGVDIVIHAAALKHVELGEYNPIEPILTNVNGTINVAEACLDAGVRRAILISSDKAVYPVNLYGATKMLAERVFIQGNVYGGKHRKSLAVVRYGNVLGSRGSVVPFFLKQKELGVLHITHPEMTRFWITLNQACVLVERALDQMKGGEIFIPKLPSIAITDLAKAVAPRAKIKIIGIRSGEKLHETLLTQEESVRAKSSKTEFVVMPQMPFWSQSRRKLTSRKPFIYNSKENSWWLTVTKLRTLLKEL